MDAPPPAAAGPHVVPPVDNDFGRDTQHNTDAQWISSYLPLWDSVMAPAGFAFNQISFNDIQGDNFIEMGALFVARCRNNPPLTRNANPQPYSNQTVIQAFECVIRKLKHKFRRDMGQDNEAAYFPPAEITALKNELRDNRSRNLMEDDSDLFKGVYPIPRKHSSRTILFRPYDGTPEDHAGREATKRVDLLTICKGLFLKCKFKELAYLIGTHNAVGRGGEIKFLSYKNMFMDEALGVLFAQWFQRKTLKTNPTGYVPDFEHPELCFFFNLGCYWACDNGLMRDVVGEPGTPQWRRSMFVFPHLHSMQDKSVAKAIGDILKSEIADALKKYYSAKSLRYGAMSLITWDPAVTYEEAVALGGWLTNCNRDWYIWQYLVAIIPAIKSLAGYPDARVLPSPPGVDILANSQQLDVDERLAGAHWANFIKKLFPCNLACFNHVNGSLRPFLITVAATMIMHFDYFYRQYAMSHPYTHALVRAVIASGVPKVANSASKANAAVAVLTKWASIVKADFVARNSTPAFAFADEGENPIGRQTLHDLVVGINSRLADLIAAKAQQQQVLIEQRNELQEVRGAVTNLQTQFGSMLEMLDLVIHQNSLIAIRLASIGGQAVENAQNAPVQEAAPAMAAATGPDVAAPAVAVAPVTPPANPQEQRRQEILVAANARQLRRQAGLPVEADPVPPPAAGPEANVVGPMLGLNRHRVIRAADARRGSRNGREKLDLCFFDFYRNEEVDHFFGPIFEGRLALDDRTAFINMSVFNAREVRNIAKIKRTLQLVDALWTPQERKDICKHRLTDGQAQRFFTELGGRCKRVAFLVHYLTQWRKTQDPNKLPRSTTPTAQMGQQILGLANKMTTNIMDLESFVPKWDQADADGLIVPRTSAITLMEWADNAQHSLQQLINQHVNN